MSWNPYKRLLALLPGQPTDIGQVTEVAADGVVVRLRTGGLVRVRGAAEVGAHVYVRAGAIEGPAPDLVGVDLEV